MVETLLVLDWLGAAATAGLNLTDVLMRVSMLVKDRHAKGLTINRDDLAALFDAGDEIERAAAAQFAKTLADPNTPVRP